MPESKKGAATRLASRIIGAMSALALIATCILLLIKGKSDVASYPAIGAGIIGYLILRPGKRSVRINMGGVVVDVMSDDTGAFQTGVDAVVTQITHEISGRTLDLAREASPPPFIKE